MDFSACVYVSCVLCVLWCFARGRLLRPRAVLRAQGVSDAGRRGWAAPACTVPHAALTIRGCLWAPRLSRLML